MLKGVYSPGTAFYLMPRESLSTEYEKVMTHGAVQNWLNSLNGSKATRSSALYSLHRWCAHAGEDPEALLRRKEFEQRRPEPRQRFETEDRLRAFAKGVRGAYVYAAYVKSFYAANHMPLDLRLVRPPPQREPSVLPDDAKLRALVSAAGSKQLKSLILFLADSGARIGSVLQLRYRHIRGDLEAGRLPCRVAFPAQITKGGRAYVGFVGDDAAAALRDYLAWRTTDRVTKDVRGRKYTLKGRPLTDESSLFESRNGKPLSKTTTILRIETAAFAAGLNPTNRGLRAFHPYLLRARTQTIMEAQGLPLNWIDLMLGHSPRGAQGMAYSKPTDEQLRQGYARAYGALRIFKPAVSEEDRRRLNELGALDGRLAVLEGQLADLRRAREAELAAEGAA